MTTKKTKQNTIIVKLMVVVTLLVCLTACPNVNDGSSYTITYNANGATSGDVPAVQTKTHGIDLIIASNSGNLAITGYTFTGWNTQADGKGTTYAAGASYTVDANITLYAKWIQVFPNITINDIEYGKTGEIVVIAKGTTATVNKTDDSSWSSYLSEEADDYYKGVFIKDRNVTLSPFIMGKYEVTQELYQAVMGTNPSYFKGDSKLPASGETQKLRPVEYVTWYKAVEFCNKLTKATMTENDYVYYTDAAFTTVYKSGNVNVYMNPAKKGYRLPTEAEWEFAARGGDPSAEAWGYAYAGVQTEKDPSAFTSSPYEDTKLDNFDWYKQNPNTNNKTHEVGKKTENALGLYDMSGNVSEWCYDWFGTVSTEEVTNPTGPSSGSYRVKRGGSWGSNACSCSVSIRDYRDPSEWFSGLGFRVCRSQ